MEHPDSVVVHNPLSEAAAVCQSWIVNPALVQRLVTFNIYFFGFLIPDRLSYFGTPPSATESWLMALVLGLAVTLLSPVLARWLSRRASDADRDRRGERRRMARDEPKTSPPQHA